MPLPLSTLTIEAIAAVVDRWRQSQITAPEALDKIGTLMIGYRRVSGIKDHTKGEDV